ncbi:hypothetical protein A3K74_01050 [Candidatus Pacearchaeota archaeon RBG_13_33_26]|nr:MAG: hypothetical protein A3K74_01050 [Candidatus Pacearchaeota archaeon RBG_13_33_26]
MRRGIIILISIILACSFISAEIIFTQPIKAVNNLGDNIFVPVTIKTLSKIEGTFQMNLVCNGTEINFYKNGIKLTLGEEKSLDSSLVLIKNIIGGSNGFCKIKAILGADYTLSNEFKISNALSISGNLGKTEFDSGEKVALSGKITRETGENAEGFIETNLITNDVNQNVTQTGTITQGNFNINISLPSDLKAGTYSIELNAYELDSDGLVTNRGGAEYKIFVRQVPTNLELIFENKEISPGTSLKIKAILHDQTGESINSTVFLTIKDSADKILEQKEISTDEFLDYYIKPNERPAEWKIFAVSNKLTAEDKFAIKEKEEVNIEIVNKTILITNTGNIFYNKTLLIKVGDTPLNIQAMLDVGESKKYLITAPDGEYEVKVITGNENEISKIMSLTGKTVGIKEASNTSFWGAFWVFVILILGFVAFIFFKKIYQKPFLGKFIHKGKKEKFKKMAMGEDSQVVIKTGNKAELSLSIKGEKQDASVICLRIKNLRESRSGRGSTPGSIEKAIEAAEENKAVTYENQDYLFFIFAPAKTRTFKNEKTALDVAEKIQGILSGHNRMFNQKVDFGISLHYGTIVGKQEGDIFKFMSMGSLITIAKKIANLSEGEVLLSEKINDALRLHIKTEKKIKEGISVFSVKEVKREVDEATKKFINRFMERQKRKE